ncbi:MAG: carboxypeptidase regulatory-like domain-containing protein [Syntrophomonas sp.]
MSWMKSIIIAFIFALLVTCQCSSALANDSHNIAEDLRSKLIDDLEPIDRPNIDFKVLKTEPSDEFVESLPDSVITVTFSDFIDRNSVNVETFYLLDQTLNKKVNGEITFIDIAPIVIFSPDDLNDMINGHQYMVMVSGSIQNRYEDKLGDDQSWSFTFGQQPVVQKRSFSTFSKSLAASSNNLYVLSVTPENGADDVEGTAEISAVLSKDLDPATITKDNITVEASPTVPLLAYDVSYNEQLRKISIKISYMLYGVWSGYNYKITLKKDLKDIDGNTLGMDYSWSFTAKPTPFGPIYPDSRFCTTMAGKDNKIAWLQRTTDYTSINLKDTYTIFAADLLNGKASNIQIIKDGLSSDSVKDVSLAVYQENVAWAIENDDGTWGLFNKNLVTDEEKEIANQLVADPSPDLYGNNMVYVDYNVGSGDIKLFNLEDNSVTPIVDNAEEQNAPRIFGDRIVWVDKRNGNEDIYLYDLKSKKEFVIASGPTQQITPDLWGDTVVWDDLKSPGCGIYYKVLNDEMNNEVKPLFDDNISQRVFPRIYKNKVVYQYALSYGFSIQVKEIDGEEIAFQGGHEFYIEPIVFINDTDAFFINFHGDQESNICSYSYSTKDDAATPLTVVDFYPKPDYAGVKVGDKVYVKFSQEVDTASVNSETFYIVDMSTNEKISGKIQYNSQVGVYYNVPNSKFTYDNTYEVTVTSGVKSISGLELTPASWTFTTPQENTIPLSTTAIANNEKPAIYDNNVVWMQGSYYVMGYVPGIDKKESVIYYKPYPVYATNPSIWGDRVCFTPLSMDTQTLDIYMVDFTTKEVTPICTDLTDEDYAAKVSGNMVAWVNSNNEYWVEHIPSAARYLIDYNVVDGYDTYRNRMAYAKKGHVWCYNFHTGNWVRDYSLHYYQTDPDIWMDKIVWFENNNIWVGKITDSGIVDRRKILPDQQGQRYMGQAKIYGNNIVWMEWRNEDYDIYCYNLSTNEEKALVEQDGHQLLYGIYGNKIVWTNGYRTAYLTQFEDPLPDTIPPSAPGDIQVDINDEGEVELQWDPAADDLEVTGYIIERSTDQLNWSNIGHAYEYGVFSDENTVAFTDSNVVNDINYFYRVLAYDAAGNQSVPSKICQSMVEGQLKLTLLSGGNQSQATGNRLSQPIIMKLMDQYNQPVEGKSISIEVVSGNAVIDGDAVKNSSEDGAVQYQAVVNGLGEIVLKVTDTSDKNVLPEYIKIFGVDDTVQMQGTGGSQSGLCNNALPVPFSVTVQDSNGNPIPNIAVIFKVVAGEGKLLPEDRLGEGSTELVAVADDNGVATVYGIPGFGANIAEALVVGTGQKIEFRFQGTASSTIQGTIVNYQDVYYGRGYGNLEIYTEDEYGNQGSSCPVDDNGNFDIPVNEGLWSVGIKVIDEETNPAVPVVFPAPRKVMVSPGTMNVNFSLTPATFKLTGKVTDEKGFPFLKAHGEPDIVQVWASSLNHPDGPAVSQKRRTNSSGEYEMYLPEGSFSLGCKVEDTILIPERYIEISGQGITGDTWLKVPCGTCEISGTLGTDTNEGNVLVTAFSKTNGLAFTNHKLGGIYNSYNLKVPPGTYEVRAFHNNTGEMAVNPWGSGLGKSNIATVSETQSGKISFITQYQNGQIKGKVLFNTEDMAPVAGATVNLYNPVSKIGRSTRTNALGDYELTLPADSSPYIVEVWYKDLGLAARAEATIILNQETLQDFNITKPCVIGGTVTSGNKAVEGALISALSTDDNEYVGCESALDGSYKLCLKPGNKYKLTVWVKDYLEKSVDITAANDLLQDFDLEEQQVIKGKVEDGTGQSLSNVWVEAFSEGGRSFGAFTKTDGTFVIYLPSGSYVLLAAKPGYYQQMVFKAETSSDTDYTIKMPLAEYSISGSVTDSNNKPLAYGNVWAQNEQGDIYQTKTDIDGNYNIGLYPGPWNLFAFGEGYQRSDPYNVTIVDSNTTCDIKLSDETDQEAPGLAVLKTNTGGIVKDEENGLNLIVPPGMVGDLDEVTIITSKNNNLLPTTNYNPVASYDFSAFTNTGSAIKNILSQNMEAHIRYTRDDLQIAGIEDNTSGEDSLCVAYFDEAAGNWVEVPSVQDTRDPDANGGGMFIVRSNHFTEFSVVKPSHLILLGYRYKEKDSPDEPIDDNDPDEPTDDTHPHNHNDDITPVIVNPVNSIDDSTLTDAVNQARTVGEVRFTMDEKRTELTLEAAQLALVRAANAPVAVTVDKITVKIPPALLNLTALATGSKLEVHVEKVSGNNMTNSLTGTQIKIAGEIYEISVSAVNKDGSRTPLQESGSTYTLALPVPADFKGDPASLKVYRYNEAAKQWEKIGGEYDEASKSTVVFVDHFSKYALFEEPEQSISFSDLSGCWAEKQILEAAQKGIFKGVDGKALPDAQITRAEFAAFLVRAFNLKAKAGDMPFKDAGKNSWYYQPLLAAYTNNLIKGYSPDTIGPQDNITREQIAAMLDRAASLSPVTNKTDNGKGRNFTDESEISTWATDAVYRLSGFGVIGGYPDGTFKPKKNATRAEGIVMILKVISK